MSINEKEIGFVVGVTLWDSKWKIKWLSLSIRLLCTPW